MKELIVVFTENKWCSLDLKSNDFTQDHKILIENEYYTFQVPDFLREIKRNNLDKIPKIVNIESLDKQFSQVGRDLMDFKKWHILKCLRRENIISSDYRINDLNDFLLKLKDFISKLNNDSSDETGRFNDIEVIINEIIHKTSFDGIKIDETILDNKCQELHKEIYRLKNEIQFSHNIFQPEYFETQTKYLRENNYKILSSTERTVSLLRKNDSICNTFRKINRLTKDLRTLLLLKSRLGGVDYVKPYFVGFGTITSRIIVKEPSLQNLKKENRDIIIPNEEKELFYIDYGQFEASILAHYSEDKALLKIINEGDIYSDIVKEIYNIKETEEIRKEAKILFYRYLYGDTFENKNEKNFKNKVENYFNKFIELSKFKQELIDKSLKEGKVGTLNANYRILNTNNENIWILSHFIQSKASYILDSNH